MVEMDSYTFEYIYISSTIIVHPTLWNTYQTELNLTHFYTKPNFLLALWKDFTKLFQKQLEVLKKYVLVKLCRKEIYRP